LSRAKHAERRSIKAYEKKKIEPLGGGDQTDDSCPVKDQKPSNEGTEKGFKPTEALHTRHKLKREKRKTCTLPEGRRMRNTRGRQEVEALPYHSNEED